MKNSYLFHNAVIYDPESNARFRGMILVENGCITKVARENAIDPKTVNVPLFDCQGGFLMPGFHDAHVHLVFGGETLARVNAKDFPDKDDLLGEIERRAKVAKSKGDASHRCGWVLGYGLVPDKLSFTLEELNAACGDVPFSMGTHDLHSIVVNSAALRIACITNDVLDPAGGRYDRDTNGNLNGMLLENAALLFRPHVPVMSTEDIKTATLNAQAYANSLGITSVDENVSRDSLSVFCDLEKQNSLNLRIHGWRNDGNLNYSTLDLEKYESDYIKVDTVKLFADGALGSRSAYMFEDFLGGSNGSLVVPLDDIYSYMTTALQKDWRLAVHAIGDAAVSSILDCFVRLKEVGLHRPGLLNRIEHLQFIKPADIKRFVDLGLIAGIQPLHCGTDQDHFEGLLSAIQIERTFIWQSLLKAGILTAVGTDWPVENLDPRLNLYHGSTRKSVLGRALIGQSESLTINQLLKAMTWSAAEAAGWQDRFGKLKAGYRSDLVLLSHDPQNLSAEQLLNLKIKATFSDGVKVY
jgi:predicted amidohydrolase YtcJ